MSSFYEEKASAIGQTPFSLEFAQELDKQDDLAEFRSQFIFPEAPETSGRKEVIYLCGKLRLGTFLYMFIGIVNPC